MTELATLRDLSPDNAAYGAGTGGDLPSDTTYYGMPLLKRPHWDWNVVAYLFLGGVMGGSGLIAAFCDRRGDDAALSRNARYSAFILAAVNPVILIGHLGRPERFHHMLRIVKFKSVMSMGVWGLLAFSLPASLAATAELARTPLMPGRLRWLRHLAPPLAIEPLLAVLGAFIAGYTGVLISATAIPLWAAGKRHIPMASVCSGLAGACALQGALLALSGEGERSRHKLERLELLASLCELAVILDFERHLRSIGPTLGAPMFAGARGRKLRTVTLLGGIAVPSLLSLAPAARWKTVLASALTLCGGYVFRETVIEAGKDSADDPKVASRQPE